MLIGAIRGGSEAMVISIRRIGRARDTVILIAGAMLVGSCGGGNSASSGQYMIEGTVSGLMGSGLVLQNNAGSDLAIAENGSFAFSAPLFSGSTYAVSVNTQPTTPTQTCVLAGASGTVTDANVSTVVVTCTMSPGRFAYVGSHSGLYCFAVDAVTGALTPLASSPCDTGDLTGVAVDPSGQFAYATQSSLNEVNAYTINSATGALTPIAGSQLNGGGVNPVDITVDPSGQFVYMANYNSGSISAFVINSVTGGLTAVPGSPFPTAPASVSGQVPAVSSLTVDPMGRFLYAAVTGGNDVSAYVINTNTGALVPAPADPIGPPYSAGRAPTTVRVDPPGTYVYVTNENSASISAYYIDPNTGDLMPEMYSPFASVGGANPAGMAITPSGDFLYTANSVEGTISAFSIGVSAGIKPISGSPFGSGYNLYSVAVHPSGKFLYVTDNENGDDGTISTYSINSASGSLALVSSSPIPSGYGIAFSN
jgi:6-phosphogluconolactonase